MAVATSTDRDRSRHQSLLREEGVAELESQHQRMQSAAGEHAHDGDLDEILHQHAAAVRNYRMLADEAARIDAHHEESRQQIEQQRSASLAKAQTRASIAEQQRSAFAAQAIASRDLDDLEAGYAAAMEEIHAGMRAARERAEDAFQALRDALAGAVTLTRLPPVRYSAWDMSAVSADGDALRRMFPSDEHPAVSAGMIVSRMRQADENVDPGALARAEELLRALEQAAADAVEFAAERELHYDAWSATGCQEGLARSNRARHLEQDAAAGAYRVMIELADLADRWLPSDDEDDEW